MTKALNREAGLCSASRERASPKANFPYPFGGRPSLAYTGCLITKKIQTSKSEVLKKSVLQSGPKTLKTGHFHSCF